MEVEKGKVSCGICNWQGKDKDMLSGTNPFDNTEEIFGCPECKSIDSLFCVCDEPGCWEIVSCGTPTEEGYRSTCNTHDPFKNKTRGESDDLCSK